MKATLEFALPEESDEHREALAGGALGAVLRDLDAELRSLAKHGGGKTVHITTVRERIRGLLSERDLLWILG